MTIGVGSILRGKYRVDSVLGVGGMGMVLGARHLRLDQRVAIKVLLPEMLAHPEVVERFGREARAASRIDNDHVARVTDVDTLEDGSPFLVMEYLEGRDLSFVRGAGVPLPPSRAVDVVLQACDAIGAAHALGVVHRDLKPANLFLARRRDGTERVKVLDFGISKLIEPGGAAGVTKTSAIMGSAEYMSPEQMLSSRDVDGRTDVWALGVVLFELCTAKAPFPGETLPQVCAQVLTQPAPRPTEIAPEIPAGLEVVILRCLEKDRDRRFGTAAELAAALVPFASRAGEVAPLGPPAAPGVRPGVEVSSFAATSADVGAVAATALAADARHIAIAATAPTAIAPAGTTTAGIAREELGDAVAAAAPRRRSALPLAAAGGAIALVAVAIVGARFRGGAAEPGEPPRPVVAASSAPSPRPEATLASSASSASPAVAVASGAPATSAVSAPIASAGAASAPAAAPSAIAPHVGGPAAPRSAAKPASAAPAPRERLTIE
jgi:serine/threonine-protein kinase